MSLFTMGGYLRLCEGLSGAKYRLAIILREGVKVKKMTDEGRCIL